MDLIKDISNGLENKILKAIDDYKMISYKDTIIVGVSGGADSMLLLHFLLKFSKKLDLKIIVAHVNHCLRGKESDRDESFVREFCKKNDVLFKSLKVDINKISKEKKQGLEECGRNLRYEFFNSLNLKDYKIATAHNLSDYAETVILNLIKGSGISGLLGIPAKRNNIIRPILYLKKNEIKDYCKENNILYIEDSSNFSDDYTRNKIRLKVAPVLREINPNFENAIINMGSILKSDNDYLNSLAEYSLKKSELEGNKYNLNVLNELDVSLKTRCIKMIISKVNKNFSISYLKMNLILKIMDEKKGSVNLYKNVFLKVKNNLLELFYLNKEKIDWETNFIKDNINLTVNKRMFIIKVVKKFYYDNLLKSYPEMAHYAIDFDKIPEKCLLRNRREHDEFRPKNRNICKSLKKFFNEQKLEASKRYDLAMIANNNKIFWIETFGSSDDVKVTNNTRKVLLITGGTSNA